jgi:hypothetical protein
MPTLAYTQTAGASGEFCDFANRVEYFLEVATNSAEKAVFDAYGWPHDVIDEEILASC